MYMTVKTAIDRLLDITSIKTQFVPFVTGPGAVKNGIVRTIGGNGYPTAGEYLGLSNRNVTIIGSGKMARASRYIRRDSIRKAGQYQKMNMTHYNGASTAVGGKTHSCYAEIYKNAKTIV